MRIHFIGIGGIGVSALAQYFLKKRHEVSGSDLASSKITDQLKEKGAKIIIGPHQADNVPRSVEMVVFSPAVQKQNPELREAQKIQLKNPKLKILSYPEALGELTKKHFTIAVSGTNGKSTTTAMVSLILLKAGLDPNIIIGTKMRELKNSKSSLPEGENYRVGKGEHLIIEADEYASSFLNYWPKIIVITNIEEDHLDYFKNLENILKTFKEYANHLPEEGFLVLNKDDKNSKKILDKKQVFKTYEYSINDKDAQKLKSIMKLPGKHIIYDALAALSTARILGIKDEVSFEALSEFKGTWRRFQEEKISIQNKKITVISDYGHNPTKFKVTAEAAREKFPKAKIWCIYQPHQYQRTYFLFKEFINNFKKAPLDRLIITDIYDVAGREDKKIREAVNSEKLAQAVKKDSIVYIPQKNLHDHIMNSFSLFDVLIVMGAGDIYKLFERLVSEFKEK